MSDWQTLTLVDVCSVITDGAHQSPKTVANGKPMASVKDLTRFGVDLSDTRHIAPEDFENLAKQGCRPQVGDVLIAKDGNSALDTVCTVDKPLDAVLLSSVAILRPNPDVLDSNFLKFYLSSPDTVAYLKSNFISGAAIPRVVLRDFKRAEISLPNLEAQKRISDVLQTIDDKIDLNRRINQTLEAMAQAIFKSWFVDFDPVKTKIAAIEQGQDPLRAAMRAISGKADAELDQMPRERHNQLAATAALFPDEMEESALGEIPKGWKVSTIGEMVVITGGATPDTKNESYWNPPEHFWTSPKDLSGMQSPVLLATERKISTAGLSRIGSGLLPKGTLLMSSRAPIGYLAITRIPVAINQGYIAMLPGGKLPPLYLLMWCQQNMEEIKGQANGSTFMEISKKAFRPMRVIYPGPNLMDRFVETVTSLFGQIVEGVKESSQLSELRDTLLPKLLSGELSATARSKEMELDL